MCMFRGCSRWSDRYDGVERSAVMAEDEAGLAYALKVYRQRMLV